MKEEIKKEILYDLREAINILKKREKKDLEELKSYFKDIYPHIYEHYKFLFDIRTKSRSFEFLLAFESLITLIFITLFQKEILQSKR